jgi:hypothetical protein
MRLKLIAIIAIITGCLAPVPIVSYAQTLESSNYKIEESFIGPSGDIESSSSNYSSIGSLGDIGVGESNPGSGGNFKTIDGYTTTDDPSLTFAVDTSNISFGSLSLSSTSTSTATFSAYNYTSFGYVIQIVGPPPSSGGGHTLDAMASTSSPSIGTEQFGINLAANTSPISFGAVPTQVPSASFSYGTAATGYNTANQYRYVNGETIAHATKSSGRTDYTISYITNISTSTPGGSYTGAQELVCVGTY